jgi:hypothetical protein
LSLRDDRVYIDKMDGDGRRLNLVAHVSAVGRILLWDVEALPRYCAAKLSRIARTAAESLGRAAIVDIGLARKSTIVIQCTCSAFSKPWRTYANSQSCIDQEGIDRAAPLYSFSCDRFRRGAIAMFSISVILTESEKGSSIGFFRLFDDWRRH